MKRLIGLVAAGGVVVQAVLLAGGGDPVREPQFPTGGTLESRGQEVKPGILRLEMGIVPLAAGIRTLGGIKVFAEPSHTLLFAAADPTRLGDGGLAAITVDHPAARVEGDLGAELSPAVTIRMASATDTRIWIDYVLVGTDGTRVLHTVRDVAVGSLSRFGFKTGPRLRRAAGTFGVLVLGPNRLATRDPGFSSKLRLHRGRSKLTAGRRGCCGGAETDRRERRGLVHPRD